MGGYVALAFAREFPGRVSSLGLISSQVLADTPEKKAERYATARQVQTDGVAQVADAMASKLAEDERVRSFVHRVIGVQAARALSCALQAMANRPDSLDIFRAFRFPVLIVHGQADALIPVERAREMQATLPSARYVELPGVGHMPMMEDSRAVAQAIRFFLRDQPRSVKVLDS
jgi:pimeloyl-ACP methyl ester carboxylesterase